MYTLNTLITTKRSRKLRFESEFFETIDTALDQIYRRETESEKICDDSAIHASQIPMHLSKV